MSKIRLSWNHYKYFPYEKELAVRELNALLGSKSISGRGDRVEIDVPHDTTALERLTYFRGWVNGNSVEQTTLQARIESSARNGKNRQATRYSVHGMHEYKGKFNPQIAKSILNLFGVTSGKAVLDPFCGSGTTLVEAAHLGASGFGVDVNPFAVFVANAKLKALVTPADELQSTLRRLEDALHSVTPTRAQRLPEANDRMKYLQGWFDQDVLDTVEHVRRTILNVTGTLAPVFLTMASNLLRSYSLQDPNDLRIRRRKSPLPDEPFTSAFLGAASDATKRIRQAQSVVGVDHPLGETHLTDIRGIETKAFPALFDAAITSPPYAMALPYIDTQRLSLVWLDLVPPRKILKLESELIGSREMRGDRNGLVEEMKANAASLPREEADFCRQLQAALGPEDGFRRVAVPRLLYRYFSSMQSSFEAVSRLLKPRAPFGLIVGHNHTTLGGTRFNIQTPDHLANLAQNVGWVVDELLPLQTYRRYGYHVSNAVSAETLVLLKNK